MPILKRCSETMQADSESGPNINMYTASDASTTRRVRIQLWNYVFMSSHNCLLPSFTTRSWNNTAKLKDSAPGKIARSKRGKTKGEKRRTTLEVRIPPLEITFIYTLPWQFLPRSVSFMVCITTTTGLTREARVEYHKGEKLVKARIKEKMDKCQEIGQRVAIDLQFEAPSPRAPPHLPPLAWCDSLCTICCSPVSYSLYLHD